MVWEGKKKTAKICRKYLDEVDILHRSLAYIMFDSVAACTVDYLKLRTEKNNYFSSCSKF